MATPEWLSQVQQRIAISEGSRATAYYDTKGVLTVGIGFNLERSDAHAALEHIGCTDIAGIFSRTASLSQVQIALLFSYSFGPIIAQARASLASGIFDAMTDARRFVICDLVFNMGPGEDGWGGFTNTHALINQAQAAKNGRQASAHGLFVQAAQHLKASDWFGQVGDRAGRDCAMLAQGAWAGATGNGSDIWGGS